MTDKETEYDAYIYLSNKDGMAGYFVIQGISYSDLESFHEQLEALRFCIEND